MRHATKEAVSTTRRLVPHMFRILGIAMLLCLALGLSFSLPASAHQARPTIAASCTATQTKTVDSPTGDVTVFSDQSPFPGPATSNNDANAPVKLDASGNVCSFSLTASFTVTDPHTHNTVTVSAVTPCSSNGSMGTFNSTTGALTLNGTLTLNNVPLFQGPQTTACASLTTEGSVTTNGGVKLTGSRVNSTTNAVTLVGATSFGSGFFVVHTWAQFVGTFK